MVPNLPTRMKIPGSSSGGGRWMRENLVPEAPVNQRRWGVVFIGDLLRDAIRVELRPESPKLSLF
jgi:hypothetical protein